MKKEEILIQDALKHLAECKYDERPVSPEGLADELNLSRGQVDRLLLDLKSAGLLESGSLELTETGKDYALHVLRAHRLYEAYLAQMTGVREDQWHQRANVEEHKLTPRDVDELAQKLDYPRYDPHGDPIPTATGEMPPKRGLPLTDYPVGWTGRVVHLEDDPPQLYSLISAASIAPGTMLRIEEKDDKGLQVFTEGCRFRFPSKVCRQITVEPLDEGTQFDESLRRLSSLSKGEQASIAGLSTLVRGLERNRLLDLGFVPGTVVTVELVSPSGDPIAYSVRGASIALRRKQAERVLIRKREEPSDE